MDAEPSAWVGCLVVLFVALAGVALLLGRWESGRERARGDFKPSRRCLERLREERIRQVTGRKPTEL